MRYLVSAAVAALSMVSATQSRAANISFVENEPNDTFASSQFLDVPFGAGVDQTPIFTINGSVAGEALGVVDWYSFVIPPINDGVAFRGVSITVFRDGLGTFLPYRFTDAAGTLIDTFDFQTQTGGTFYLGIENVAGAAEYTASVGITAVPEPTTWALMLTGFGMAGYALRRRRSRIATVIA